jgi:hypothetical protein
MEHSRWVQRASRMPFQDSMMCMSFFSFPQSSADPRLDGNRILKTNACRPNCLTPKKPKAFSPCPRIPNPSPRHPRLATSPCPLLGRSKRASQRPCHLLHSRPRRASRAWAGLRRTPRRRRRRARCLSGDATGATRVWGRRGRVRGRGDGVWSVRFL